MQVKGGGYFQVEGQEGLLPSFPPLPQWALLCLVPTPVKEGGGAAGPLSAVVAQSPMGGVVWLQRRHGVGCPMVREGGLTATFPSAPPAVAWCCCSDTPEPLDSAGSPSLGWTKDVQRRGVHTQAVQPSYSWARLSRLVASLMTKSTWKHRSGR